MQRTLTESIQFDKYRNCHPEDLKPEIRSAALSRDGRVLSLDLSLNFIMSAEEIEDFRSRILKKLPGVHHIELNIETHEPMNAAELKPKEKETKKEAAVGPNPVKQ